jgi:hypothetical protein
MVAWKFRISDQETGAKSISRHIRNYLSQNPTNSLFKLRKEKKKHPIEIGKNYIRNGKWNKWRNVDIPE